MVVAPCLVFAAALTAGKSMAAFPDEEQSDYQLKLSIAAIPPEKPEDSCSFRVTFENGGNKDAMLNLGIMLGNGRVQLPDAIKLILTNPNGKSREVSVKLPGMITGRMDDYVVSLRAGSIYSLKLGLDHLSSPENWEYNKLTLVSGSYSIHTGAKALNLDTPGVGTMSFWLGTLKSDEGARYLPVHTRF